MTDPKVKRFDIDYHTVQLLLNEPFWGHISRRVTKVCTDQVATAGVTVKDGDLRMVYNPGFCSTLVEEEGEKNDIGSNDIIVMSASDMTIGVAEKVEVVVVENNRLLNIINMTIGPVEEVGCHTTVGGL